MSAYYRYRRCGKHVAATATPTAAETQLDNEPLRQTERRRRRESFRNAKQLGEKERGRLCKAKCKTDKKSPLKSL